jgi:hypothetical protein
MEFKLKTIHFQLPIDTLPFSLFNRISILSDTCVRQPAEVLQIENKKAEITRKIQQITGIESIKKHQS